MQALVGVSLAIWPAVILNVAFLYVRRCVEPFDNKTITLLELVQSLHFRLRVIIHYVFDHVRNFSMSDFIAAFDKTNRLFILETFTFRKK